MKKMQNMSGFFVAAVTPFDEAGKFSASALHKLMDKTIAEGAKGFLIGGSSAECPRSRMWNAWRGWRPPRSIRIAPRRSSSLPSRRFLPDEAVEYAKTAKELGYDAMISTVPYYYKFGMKAISGVLQHAARGRRFATVPLQFPRQHGRGAGYRGRPHPRHADRRHDCRREADQSEPLSDGAHSRP